MGIDWWVVKSLLTVTEITAKQLAEVEGAIHGFRLQKYDLISHGRLAFQIFRSWLAAIAWPIGGLPGATCPANIPKYFHIRWDGLSHQFIG